MTGASPPRHCDLTVLFGSDTRNRSSVTSDGQNRQGYTVGGAVTVDVRGAALFLAFLAAGGADSVNGWSGCAVCAGCADCAGCAGSEGVGGLTVGG